MDVVVVGGRKREGVTTISTVISGSVWDKRMKMDEVKGGIKVFNGGEDTNKESRLTLTPKPMSKRSPTCNDGVVNAKRKIWNSDSSTSEGSEKSPTKITKGKSESKRNSDEQSIETIKKSPIQVRKLRSEGIEDNSLAIVKTDRSPFQLKKSKSEIVSSRSNEKNTIQLRKVKSESIKTVNDNGNAVVISADRITENSEQPKNPESESSENVDKFEKGIDESVKEAQFDHGSDENCKEFGVCHISISSTSTNLIKSAPEMSIKDENEDDEYTEDEANIENEKPSFDIKEISLPEPRKVVNEVKKFQQFYQKPVQNSTTIKQIYTNPSKPTPTSESDEYHQYHSFQEKNSKLQSLVDLVMWKDVSRSAFVFGIGSFIILSSSYTKDINISFISVMSYLGLIYLGATFLYRSIICRGVIDMEKMRDVVVGEEEAVWVLKLLLPYLNEFLLKLRALFCGDPQTTMKLAVLLFALARCGSSITIWKVAKWGFFVVFSVPKVCSSYSSQLTAYAKFWVRRFKDAWESCSHKKGVAIAIFVLVWNLSSVVARIWAAFMLFVAFRYYQQALVRGEWEEEGDEVVEEGDTCQNSSVKEICNRGSLFVGITHTKQKKKY